jgi:hypothetical protein
MRRIISFVVAAVVVATCFTPAVAAAEQRSKRAAPVGKAPKQWDLPKPDIASHPDTAPVSAGGNGDGYNGISFTYFDSGDIVVVLGTGTGHAGIFDRAYYTGLYSYAVWSANTTPRNGVQREACIKYRTYDVAYAVWMPAVSGFGSRARYYARAQSGEPYNIGSSKTNQSSWYCSKLAWAAWRYTAGIDLDGDGGYWVWPVDLLGSKWASIFGYWG